MISNRFPLSGILALLLTIGACTVVEEINLSPNILISEIDRLIGDKILTENMKAAAKVFYKPDAAKLVAEEILKIALEHEIEK